MVGWIKMKLGTEVGLAPRHIVLDGDSAPPERGHSPASIFSAHVCRLQLCQTAGWIKMTLGREVGFGPGDVVLYGNPAPPYSYALYMNKET